MKKSIGILAAAVFSATALAACGGGSSAQETTAAATEAAKEETAKAEEETTEAKEEAPAELKKIVVGASPAPHAEILRAAKDVLAKKGYELEILEYVDYIQPNLALESEDLDANYFQHIPYLDSFNEEQGTHLVNAGGIHYEPFGIYPGTKSDLSEIAEGDIIAVPNDTTNEARALCFCRTTAF